MLARHTGLTCHRHQIQTLKFCVQVFSGSMSEDDGVSMSFMMCRIHQTESNAMCSSLAAACLKTMVSPCFQAHAAARLALAAPGDPQAWGAWGVSRGVWAGGVRRLAARRWHWSAAWKICTKVRTCANCAAGGAGGSSACSRDAFQKMLSSAKAQVYHNTYIAGRVRPFCQRRWRAAHTRCCHIFMYSLHAGRTRKLKITRRLIDGQTGQQVPTQEVLTIDIKPGWKDGTKITFKNQGDEVARGQPAGDVTFVVKETSHSRFTRDGNDLVYQIRISLKDALVGGSMNITHLDGSTMPISWSQPLQPGSYITIPCAP